MNKIEIDIVVGILQSLLLLAEKIHPGVENNPTVLAINKAITTMQALGL